MRELIIKCYEEKDGIVPIYQFPKDGMNIPIVGELIRCSDCKYLNVINSNAVYARCKKHGIEFLPFEDDIRKCFCSWAERKEE